MKFQRKRGVSVIIATLLLIAISVSAAIIVYVFVGGLAGGLMRGGGGQSVNEKLNIQSFNFQISPGSCGCAQQVLEIFLLDPGPGATTISSVYFDGALLTVEGSVPTSNLPMVNDAVYLLPSATTLASTASQNIYFSAATAQSAYSVTGVGQVVITFTTPVASAGGHTVKVVSTTGAQNVFTVVSGTSG